MHFERTINLRVVNWPRFCLATDLKLDGELFRDESALRRYALDRFGDGRLRQVEEGVWEFEREIRGPRWFWRAIAFILNKSYA